MHTFAYSHIRITYQNGDGGELSQLINEIPTPLTTYGERALNDEMNTIGDGGRKSRKIVKQHQ